MRDLSLPAGTHDYMYIMAEKQEIEEAIISCLPDFVQKLAEEVVLASEIIIRHGKGVVAPIQWLKEVSRSRKAAISRDLMEHLYWAKIEGARRLFIRYEQS
jgi:hypothetical protein